MDARDKQLQARSHARRLQGLAAATVVLWLAVLVVLLARM
jgi:tetrahydromethanopterin S-methyltransferase subunit F